MMYRASVVFLLTCMFAPLSGVVVPASSLAPIERHLQEVDGQALVVFDVDCTLIVGDDLILKPSSGSFHSKILRRFDEDVRERLSSLRNAQAKFSLVDPYILKCMEQLKQRHIKAIALTAISSGPYGVISNPAAWRAEQLANLGLSFEWSFPSIEELTLDGFQGKRHPPVFYRGVLASGRYPKGEVLCGFLKAVDWKPSEVIFVDDMREFIASMEAACEEAAIPHTSFHYTVAIDRSTRVDRKLAEFQYSYLRRYGVWLRDDLARKKMNR